MTSRIADITSGTVNFQAPASITTTTILADVGLSSQMQTLISGGLPTSIKQWDYYSGTAPANPTEETDFAYQYGVDGVGAPTEIDVPFLSQVTVKDGSGNQVSQTTYGYDETTGTGHAALTTVSGLPQQPQSVTGNRGNLTTISQWINTSGSLLSTEMEYDSAGTMLNSTDPNGTTTYGHDSTDTFVTSTTLPTPSSGVTLTTLSNVDSSTGLSNGTIDPNNTQTGPTSYDAFGRVNAVEVASGGTIIGKTVYKYLPPQNSEIDDYLNSTTYENNSYLVDGYGRNSRIAISNGNTNANLGWYQQDTCYDADGNVSFQSYRYQGPGFVAGKVCSGAGDSYTYDALGRVKSITHGDGTSITYKYTGRATQVTDENGVSRITQVDALGRITIVCEISSNSSMPASGSPTNCGSDSTGATDIAGTGFTTTYSYNLANHTTTVTQGAQTRIFQTDSLGRTILTKEPESGQTTYSYAYNGTGLVVTRQRPKANQTNPSVLTTTTTQYDSLGRILSISYSDGTQTRSFSYDQATAWGGSSLSLGASKGRLTGWSRSTSLEQTLGFFVYDPLGRISRMDQCMPSTACDEGQYEPSILYTYDWLGNVLSAGDGEGVTTSYSYSPASEVQSITRSPSDAVHPGTLVSNVQNGPFGPISYTLGNGATVLRLYDNRGRSTGGWVCSNGSISAGCLGGTGEGTLYGYGVTWTGSRITETTDLAENQYRYYGYDDLNRLTSLTINSGGQPAYYVYDRYGNRWGEQGGANESFNTSTNQINSSGYVYDAAGNLMSDGINTYSYDADGNLIQQTGATNQAFIYNALNQQVAAFWNGAEDAEVVFDQYGRWHHSGSQAIKVSSLGKTIGGRCRLLLIIRGPADKRTSITSIGLEPSA